MGEVQEKKIFPRVIAVLILGLIAMAIAGYAVFLQFKASGARKVDTQHFDAYYSGILKNDPTPLQNSFVADLQAGVNDKYTKSDAYFVTHRFFDNGGNVYEIYDYVNSHPELAFLKEAETIYPAIFKQIQSGTLPKTFVDRSYYAYLAYVEVLYKHGYTDIAAEGTLANEYAKLAYLDTAISKEMPAKTGIARAKYAVRDSKKALQFLKIVQGNVTAVLQGTLTSNDVTPRDILVGLNQYAAASRYLEALSENYQIPTSTSTMPEMYKNTGEVFNYTMEYSARYVPELNLFTSLLNASTLAILSSSTPDEIRAALFPILDFDPKKPGFSPTSIIHKVLDSRLEPKPANIGDTNMDIYSKRNTVRLATLVPEFKQWLMNNGWQTSDFK
jgi:hypothetical protein